MRCETTSFDFIDTQIFSDVYVKAGDIVQFISEWECQVTTMAKLFNYILISKINIV